MHFDVSGKSVFASTGGKTLDISKPAVVFLHGSGLDHTFWGLHSRFFAFRNYAVLCPDLPGHSNSEGPALTSIKAMAEWLDAVLESLQLDNVSLVAHSQGCLVALEYASRFSDKLRSVSFIASGLATPVNSALIEAAEKSPDDAINMMLSWGFGTAGHKHQGPIPGNSMIGCGRKVMQCNVPHELVTDLKACNAYRNGKAAATAIKVPVQVIVGGQDRMAPQKATQELVDHLNSPQVTVIKDCGHMVPLEAADKTRTLLKKFVVANNPAS